jgi:hypothetical protein
MAYRRPGVEVVQQFQALAPALVLPTLPAVIVGPAFQVEDDASTATAYTGALTNYSYPDLVVGAVVDLNELDSTELAATQKPIEVELDDAYITKASGSDGTTVVGDQTFTTTSTAFSGITIASTTKHYVDLNNSNSDDGKHLITSKTSDTEVELADELQNAIAGSAVYKVLLFSTSIVYETADFATVGITVSSTQVTLPANLPSDPSDATSDPISEADDVLVSYRALRPDLADSLDVYTDLDSLEAVFGVGNIVPTNPYGFGVNIALNNTTTDVSATGLRATFFSSSESAAYQTALEFLESEDVYGICILTQNTTVHQTLSSHVTNQSVSTVGRERIGFINRKLQTTETIVPASGTGTVTSAGTNNGTSPVADNKTFEDPTNGKFITDDVGVQDFLEIDSFSALEGVDPTRTPSAVTSTGSDSITSATKTFIQTATGTFTGFTTEDVGRTFRIASSGFGNDGDYTIATVIPASNTITVTEAVPADETGGTYTFQIVELAPSTAQTSFIKDTRHSISAINSNTKLTLSADPTNGFYGRLEDVEYTITDDLTVGAQATFLSGYAGAFDNRRLVSVWPDTAVVTVSGTATSLPGFYFGCALVALVAGLPSQQGFTNLSLTGFTGRANSDDLFSDTQLDTVAGGGNLIIVQEVAQAPVSVRHQLTTDTSSIQFQELSVTKNVDLVARFFRNLYQPYIGKYNITDTLLDLLKSITEAGLDFLKNSTAPRVGGVLRDGSITTLGEDSAQPDTVNIVLDINIPFPLNNVKVTLLV